MFLNTFKQISVVSLYLAAIVALQVTPVSLQPGESIQITCAQAINIYPVSPNEVTIACAGVPVSPTFSPEPTITDTAVPPSETPTVPPSATASITPLPASPSATPTMVMGHDTLHWHSVNFGHEHGDDPNAPAIVAIFGQAGDLWNGAGNTNIGVPFGTSSIENSTKHPMAKYYTMLPSQIDAAWNPNEPSFFNESTDNGGNPTTNRVRAWRVLAHGGASLMEALANNHSVFAEIQVCNRAPSPVCGTLSSGGWIFWGKFQSPFYNQVFQRSGGTFDIGGHIMTFASDTTDLATIQSPYTVFDQWGGEPYWFMFPNVPSSWSRIANGEFVGDQFSSNEVGPNDAEDCAPFPSGALCGNRLFHLAIRVFDGWNLADTTNINNPVFICSQIAPANCNYNGTHRGMKEVAVYIDPAWDQSSFDTDLRAGFVSFSRYTDRYQRLRPVGACSAIGVDCVPLVLNGVPVGYASIKLKIQDIVPGIDREYCPAGCSVSFPN